MMDAAKGEKATTAQKEAASAQIHISVGSSKSVSETKRTQDTAFASSIMAGGNVSIVALGEKDVAGSGNLSIVGSDVTGKNVLLAATNDLHLLSQAQTSTETSTNKNSGWKVGIGIGVSDSGSGGGINIFASGYAGKGNATGNGTTYQESQISARDNLTLISGGDTVLMGAQARADSIRADIGRNLTIASQQDTDRYNAKQSQVNAGGSFSFGSMTGSAYIGASIGKTKSNYDSVIEQSGLYAGSRGFDIYVGKHTQLDGAVIASDAEAAKNKLSTETFGFTNLENKAAYKSTTVGVNLGMSGAFDIANKGGANAFGPSGLSFAQTSGSDSGTTYAAVAPGLIEVRSDKVTGRDSTVGLSRDTAGANGSIGQIFDKDKVREQLEFQQAFGQLGMQIAGDALKSLEKENADLWGEGKMGRVAVHSIVAAAGAALGGGNVAGAIAGTVAGDLTVAAARDAIDAAMQDLTPAVQREVANVMLNVIASSVGALAGGLSGAGGAAVADGYNRQLHPNEKELAKTIATEARAQGLGYTVEQIEAQMRKMDVALPNGEFYAGGPAVVVGYEGISDGRANFIEVGRTESGQPILMEFASPELDRQLQDLIVSQASGKTISSGLSYTLTPARVDPMERFGLPFRELSPMARYCVTGDCAAGLQRNMTAADFLDKRNENADVLAYLSSGMGRVGAGIESASYIFGTASPAVRAVGSGTVVAGWVFGGLEQVMRPNPHAYGISALIDIGVQTAGKVAPSGTFLLNELGEYLKGRYAK